MKYIYYFLVSILFVNNGFSQDFYINTLDIVGSDNNLYIASIDNNNLDLQSICPPTNNIQQFWENRYLDMAIDYQNNIYFVSGWGSLYKKNSDDSTCEFLGKFGNDTAIINSMVVDSSNLLYAAGTFNDGSTMLYRYDINSGVFSELGNLPNNYITSGDLFFYEERLFLTAENIISQEFCVLEINMLQPELSCYYMNLNDLESLGAFSINYGSFSKSYILTAFTNSTPYSSLVEIDIPNQETGNTIRTYDYLIYGAAAYYDLTSTMSICSELSVNDINVSNLSFEFINSNSNELIIKTNIEISAIDEIIIYDITGKKIRILNNIDSKTLNVNGISPGLYLTHVSIGKNMRITKKILIH